MIRRRSALGRTRRGLYKSQRAIGDYQAVRRGRLGRRVVRRSLTRGIMRGIFGR